MLEGKAAVVTGVSSGLGRAIAVDMASSGAAVVGCARRSDLGAGLEAEVQAAGGRLRFVTADVSRPDDCARVVATALETFGGVDILVNNAGARTDPPLLPLHEVDDDNWATVLATNLTAAFQCTRAVIEPMRRRGGGTIVNIASFLAQEAIAGMGPYAASKAGMVQLTRATAVEYLDDGIRANAIILGGTATGQESRTAAAKVAREGAQSDGGTPARLYDAADVARAITLLCSDAARVITGASIAIDHGVTAGLYTSEHAHEVMTRRRS